MLRLENPTLVVSLLFDRHFGSVHSDPVKPGKEALSELVTATQRRFIFLYGLSLCEIALVQFSEPVSPLSFLPPSPPSHLLISSLSENGKTEKKERKGRQETKSKSETTWRVSSFKVPPLCTGTAKPLRVPRMSP